jgi:hypothetical protein
VGLARRAIEIFELDPELLDVTAPPDDVVGAGRIPRDTRLDATETAARLGVELPGVDAMLRRLRAEVESSWSLA